MSLRVVSLLPSATEMVCALGARDILFGVSHECDFPRGVDSLPTLTRVRKTLPKASGQIDRAVREILSDALTVYEVNVDALREASPDVIVTQDLCDVCAVSLSDVNEALRECAIESQVVSLKPTRLQDVWDDVGRVGKALGRPEVGERVASELKGRCADLASRVGSVKEAPKILTIEWLDPVMIGGTWMPELVELAGGTAMVTSPGQHAPTLDYDALCALEPDVVLIKPCGFDIERTRQELHLMAEKLPWNQWKATQSGRVFVADGNAFFNRPGPRLVESLEILAACIHPGILEDLQTKHAEGFRRVRSDLSLIDPRE